MSMLAKYGVLKMDQCGLLA